MGHSGDLSVELDMARNDDPLEKHFETWG